MGHHQDVVEPLVEALKISCAEPYFVEDDIFRPEEELKAKRPLRLVVLLSWNAAGVGCSRSSESSLGPGCPCQLQRLHRPGSWMFLGSSTLPIQIRTLYL